MNRLYRVEEVLAGKEGDGEGQVFRGGARPRFQKERFGGNATRLCDGGHVLGLTLSAVPGRSAAEKKLRGVAMKEKEGGMLRTLGRDVRVVVPEHEGHVGAGEGVTPEE
jgi:hypothetical protein